jgi:hypothetical protein
MPISDVDSGDPALPLLRADNGAVVLTFLPTVGGRLLSISVSGRELLWQNPRYFDVDLRAVRPRDTWPVLNDTFASWANVGGSKTWPAPQGWAGEGEWAGPPDAVLDAGVWTVDAAEDEQGGMIVSMTSPDDARTGLRITRRFTLPSSGLEFTQLTTFINVSNRPVAWSIWEVCQVDTSAGAGLSAGAAAIEVDVEASTATVAESAVSVSLGDYRGSVSAERVGDRLVVPIRDVVAKIGFPFASGRIAYRGPSAGLEIHFEPVPGAEYPDGGSRAEIWLQSPQQYPITELSGLHPDAYLAELEVLSPRSRIGPGASTALALRWRATN